MFDYTDPEHREGRSIPMLAKALAPVEAWKANLLERDLRDYITDVLYVKDRATSDLMQREWAIERLLEERKRAEERPMRWALQRLWGRYASTLFIIALLAVLGALAWRK